MTDLLKIYWLSIIASAVLAAGLSLLGAQLAARDRAMQTLCIGQGATFGVLLGISLVTTFSKATSSIAVSLVVFLFALSASVLTWLWGQHIAKIKSASTNTHFASQFSVLMAMGFILTAVNPTLEAHMSQKYFGDLATMTDFTAFFVGGLGLITTLALAIFAKHVTGDSFAAAILGVRGGRTEPYFTFGTVLLLCLSVQLVGFLFTVACLFIPTATLSLSRQAGLQRHLSSCAVVASLGTVVGFLLTLVIPRLPTVATVVCAVSLSSFILPRVFPRPSKKFRQVN
jgi:ABC-type Mn2+/Zn2+ transport system permease subunit